jgi:large subunit ribosomal protein L4
MASPKTSQIVDVLRSVGVEQTALLVLANSDHVISRSAANVPWAKTILASNMNIYDLFTYDHLILAKDALPRLEAIFSAPAKVAPGLIKVGRA